MRVQLLKQYILGSTETVGQEAGYETKYITLIGDHNGFNEISSLVVLWTVQQRWSKRVGFALNCCFHEAILVILCLSVVCSFVRIRKGITQGDPLSMVLCGIALLPLDEAIQ